MKSKIVAIKLACFIPLIFIIAFLSFMAFQGVNTSIVSYGKDFFPYVGSLCNVFILPALAVLLYRFFFSQEKLGKRKFCLKNGYFMAIASSLGLIFLIYSACIYGNFGYGITWMYPFDFMIVDVATLGIGIYLLLRGYKLEKTEKEKINVGGGFVIALMYIFIYMALDRFGALEMSLINNPGAGIVTLLPIYLTLLAPIVLAFGFVTNKIQAPNEHKPSKSFFACALISLAISLVGFVFCVVSVFGPNASDYMRIASPFYALDRLASLPILISLLTILSVAIPIGFVIHISRFYIGKKKEAENN